ncbi:hypothetical protein AC229_1379 [Oenococcus oeni]|nr:hypothetical protein AC229_1379 [Oenococcus oeni]
MTIFLKFDYENLTKIFPSESLQWISCLIILSESGFPFNNLNLF